MLSKKLTTFLSLLVCVCTLFAGCAGNTAKPAENIPKESQAVETEKAAEESAATEPNASQSAPAAMDSTTALVEIDFWNALNGKNGETVKALVDKFNASQDKVIVNLVQQADYYESATKLQAALISNTQPVMSMLEITQVGEFGLKNALADLGQYFTPEETDQYVEGLMKNSYVNDKLVAIPFNRSTPILYFNKDMLREKGLDENGPKNWEELRSFANAISDPANDIYGLEIPIDIWFYEAGAFQQGGHVIDDQGNADFNNEAGWAIAQLWQDMIKEGSMKAPVGQDYNAWDVAANDFLTQKVAMIETSTGALAGFLENSQGAFEVGTAFLPAGKEFGTPTGGACLSVLDKATEEQKAAAVEFIKFATNAENAAEFSKATGYLPVNKQAVESPLLQELYTQYPQFRIAFDQLEYAKSRPPIVGMREISVIIQEELKAAMADTNITVQSALEKAQQQAEDILA